MKKHIFAFVAALLAGAAISFEPKNTSAKIKNELKNNRNIFVSLTDFQ